MASLRYGPGLRLMECLRLRVKDVDGRMSQLVVREGKGQRDRATVLPAALQDPLRQHLARLKVLHDQDLNEGFGRVNLPSALERNYPHADRRLGWQFVFPASRRAADPRSGVVRRHHVAETVLQRAVRGAIRRGGRDAGACGDGRRAGWSDGLLSFQ
jgi:integrase